MNRRVRTALLGVLALVLMLVVLSGRPVSQAVAQVGGGNAVYLPLVVKNWTALARRSPNDPYFVDGTQWALNPGVAGTVDLRAREAWALTTGEPNLIVAIVDTGIDADHPELATKLLPGWNVLTNTPDTNDDNGHGTHVAGIVAATTDNSRGVAGVAWQVRLLPIKVLDSSGSGDTVGVAKGISAALDRGARVINVSLGTTADTEVVKEALAQAYARGVLVVAAAGNCGAGCSAGVNVPNYPAAAAYSLAVAATDRADQRASFSNYGSYVDVAAPGVDIYSTWPSHLQATRDCPAASIYCSLSGTSMSTPFVSGLAALLASRFPSYGPDQLAQAIVGTAERFDLVRRNDDMGCGRIDLYAALAQGADSSCLDWPGYAYRLSTTAAAGVAPEQLRPGSVLVKYRDARGGAARGLRQVASGSGLYEHPVSPGQELALIAILRADPEVAYAEPIYAVRALD